MRENFTKVLINLPRELAEQVDSAAKEAGVSRSQFIRESLCQVLHLKHKLEVEERMKRGYEEMAQINLQLARLGLSADEEAYRAYEAALSEDEMNDTTR